MPIRTLRATLTTVLLSSILLACGRASATGTDGLSLDLNGAAQKWQRAGLQNYTFESAVSCYCPLEYIGPHLVTVRSGLIASIVNKSTGAPVPIDFRQPIDSVFAFLRREQATRPQNLTVTYDALLGYPRTVKYGTPENDGGGYITIDNVRAIAP
jgi:Family of unknown function (DUF6174)